MINASPQTVRDVAQAMQLAALLDDRVGHTDDARVAAWAEQIERHKLTKSDLLDGVQAFYDSPSERAIQVGDLIHHSRKIRRDRNEREAEVERERRAELLSVKASDEVRALAAGVVLGPVKNRTKRLEEAEKALQCVTNKREAAAAIGEYFAARKDKDAS
jgi:hypothetical protein